MHDFSSLRQRAGLSEDEAAREFGVARNVLANWEEGNESPPASVMRSVELMARFAPASPIAPGDVPDCRPDGFLEEEPSSPSAEAKADGVDRLLQALLDEFEGITGSRPQLGQNLVDQCMSTLAEIRPSSMRSAPTRRAGLLKSINAKLGLNRERVARFYTVAARKGVTFNYVEKRAIQDAFDTIDGSAVATILSKKCATAYEIELLLSSFSPCDERETLSLFGKECQGAFNPRLKIVDDSMTPRMIEAIFGEFLFRSFDVQAMHTVFDPGRDEYETDFWCLLHKEANHLFDRDNALWIARFDQRDLSREERYELLRDRVLTLVTEAYDCLNNHGVLAISLGAMNLQGRDIGWELAGDITLFAERFVEEELGKGYFQPDKVEQATASHIPEIDPEAVRFDLANGGLTYLDCFVIRDANGGGLELLLLFQKHQRDETPILCPACRSKNVEGNSYPVLGVKSWECRNFVCPDRSKSNRGKRYSFLSLMKQRAIEDPLSEIPLASVRTWQRDVAQASLQEAVEMAIRHYSIAGDGVVLFNIGVADCAGRAVRIQETPEARHGIFKDFADKAFFKRFLLDRWTGQGMGEVIETGDLSFRVLQGDAIDALIRIEQNSIDGAITSPPYYNAREYSQWDNLYCYLYDMYNISRGVERVLKPGALYLYNIFDYFDNDRTITYSAMGQRRLALSALTIHAFRAAGLVLYGNVVWDKGDIEGKRGFNGGNFSPYYQAPFNCWEHVLVFAKPGEGAETTFRKLPKYLRAKPVIKMVRGENVHGHSAPFPDQIPELLTSILDCDSCVLDPFAGSMTTGRVAERGGIRSVLIERDPAYCELGLRMRRRAGKAPQESFAFQFD